MSKKASIVVYTGLVAGLILAAIAISKVLVFGSKNPPLKVKDLSLAGQTFRVELAETIGERALGLSGRDGLAEHEGMFFFFDSPGDYGFWMHDMKFSIDIIWIRGNTVVGFAENAAPEFGKKDWELTIYYPPEEVDKVLELSAGSVQKFGIKVGDAVSL